MWFNYYHFTDMFPCKNGCGKSYKYKHKAVHHARFNCESEAHPVEVPGVTRETGQDVNQNVLGSVGGTNPHTTDNSEVWSFESVLEKWLINI